MTAGPAMPEDGSEKEILLRALREYSENCEPPDLTPGCPFRRVDSKIGAWCLDECVDLLALHNAPPAIEKTEVGEFEVLRGRRPRSRRGLGVPKKAFDARERFLGDQHLETTQRETVSLVYSLNNFVSGVGRAQPDAYRDTERVIAELERRGFDVEMLIRDGMSRDIASGVLWAVLLPRIVRDDEVDVLAHVPPAIGWPDLLINDLDAQGQELVSSVLAYGSAVEHWVRTAPLQKVLAWEAPQKSSFRLLEGGRTPGGTHRWLCDRFLKTFLTDWSTDSLKAEWAYLHGRAIAPCPAEEMRVRKVDEDDIARVLADRVALKTNIPVIQTHGFVLIAVDLLREGKRASAAALFEAIIASEPDHAEAHNDFGFCILPDNPQRALFALQRAAELGFDEPANYGNRILAFALLGRLTPALDLAERFAERTDLHVGVGWMWSPDCLAKNQNWSMSRTCGNTFSILLSP